MSYGNSDFSLITWIFLIIGVLFVCFMIATCENSLVDADLKKISPEAKNEYLAYNTENWGDKIVGGNSMKKAVYATYTAIAKENNISVLNAIKLSRSKFAGQFKNKFKSFGSFFSLPNVRNAYHSDDMGKQVVIVHFTWTSCSGSGENHHCWTEHDEVVIPEIVQPKYEYEYQEQENIQEEIPMERGVGIEYEGVDISNEI